MNITFVTSFSEKYYNKTAKYSVETWKHLQGRKIAIADNGFDPDLPGIEVINTNTIIDSRDQYWKATGKKHKFWLKGMCFAWACENVVTDYIVWLDSDVKIFKPVDFEKFKPTDDIIATMISADLSHAETGFVFINRKHPEFKKWLDEYKAGWYNGLIDQVPRPWDGHIFYYTIKDYPHRNLANNTERHPQGFEDTDLLEYMFHYSGKDRKHLISKE